METVFEQNFQIEDNMVDRYGRMRTSQLLYIVQEMSGRHCSELALDYETLAGRGLFWAVSRHRAQITRMPVRGETIRVETWPMPTTRVAFPRSVVAYDQAGQELFRAISLWVLMDLDTRHMILPGKSGITVAGTLRGNELAAPNGVISRELVQTRDRTVSFTDLDRNGHMNNTRYMDWMDDLFSSDFHAGRSLRELTICYNAEAVEGQKLHMRYGTTQEGCIQVEGIREAEENSARVFSARLFYDVL